MIPIRFWSEEKEAIQAFLTDKTSVQDDVTDAVRTIIRTVRQEGDVALRRYTSMFDGAMVEDFEVSEQTIEDAIRTVDHDLLSDLKMAASQIRAWHERQMEKAFSETPRPGVSIRQIVRPVDRVGIYVPGGTASYPSTVLMNVIPARLAGVKDVIMVTPPGQDGAIKPSVLAAARIAGVDRIFTVGGAQAIAALAYGTGTIPKADLVTGPGNIWVATAKRLVYGSVGIDSVAGPTEVMIIADGNANPDFIASDMLAQAEHDQHSGAVLATTSLSLAKKVKDALERQSADLPRRQITDVALKNRGMIIVTDTLEDCVTVSNLMAPEHLEIMTTDPGSLLEGIRHAGAVFLGDHTPEPVGDYVAGPNHTLPTERTARFASALSVGTFQKRMAVLTYTKDALEKEGETIVRLAREEGLEAHARSVQRRLEEKS
jgi:histidinol dehydrogenase